MTRVNGHPIPQAAVEFELGRLIRFYAQHMPEDQVRQQMDALRERARQQAIGAKLLFDEADRLDLEVTDGEVEQSVAELVAQAGGEAKFQQLLAQQGVNKVEFAERIRRGRRVDKLVEQVTAGISDPTEADLRAHFEAHRDEYTQGEQAQAQHILVKPADDAPGSRDKALERLQTLRRQIADGADFGEVAAAHSECPSGRQAGGSLGWFGRGAMVPAFDQAVFSLAVDALSEPVETSFGFHLIKKTGRRDAEPAEYEQVREQIRDFLRHAARGEALAAFVAELRAKATVEED